MKISLARVALTGFVLSVLARSAFGQDVTVRVRGYVQVDSRFYLADSGARATNGFELRRARPIFEATVSRSFDFRIMPDFGEGKAQLMDAYADLRFRPQAALRGGKFKPPLGLERLQSASDLAFAERGVPTNLVPNRDVGLELYGELAGGVLSYAAGVFDGTQDLGNNDGDRSDAKDVVARMFVKFDGVGLGIAASTGNEAGLASSPALPSYRTPGQQTLFSYRSDGTVAGTAVADGIRRRVVPQGYFYRGPLGLLWEYAASRQGVQLGDSVATLTHRAWQVAASVVLTGERASYRGVTPRRPFDAAANTWGAVELAARYGELLLDRAAFPTFADPTKSAAGGRSWAIGVNWYLARGVRLEANYERTSFADQGAGARRPEHFLVTRMQVGI